MNYAYLDSTFSFLLDKPRQIPSEILDDDNLFLAFLTGYLDAEESYGIYPDGEYATYSIRVNAEDEIVLRELNYGLRKMGYHSWFKIAAKVSQSDRYRKNLWTLGMFRKSEILDLVRKLHPVHDEKLRWRNLMLKSPNSSWPEVASSVYDLRESILAEVDEFIAFAQSAFEYSHLGGGFS